MKIDPTRLATVDLADITTLPETDLRRILDIRNHPAIRQNMYTNHEIGWGEHIAWVERLRTAKDLKFYAVVKDGAIVGGASISAISLLHKRADWAFYLAEETQGKGIGAGLEYQFVTKAFNEFGIEKLNCEVIAFNEKVVKLHQKFGFSIEGVRREHVIRDGQKYDVVLMGITKEEWAVQTGGSISSY